MYVNADSEPTSSEALSDLVSKTETLLLLLQLVAGCLKTAGNTPVPRICNFYAAKWTRALGHGLFCPWRVLLGHTMMTNISSSQKPT